MLAERKLSNTGPSNMLAPLFTSERESINSLVPQIHPATQSLIPLINLVILCTTMSAPILAGENIMGEKVLSTTNLQPCFFAN